MIVLCLNNVNSVGYVQKSLRRNLLKEGAKLSSLDHPNILTLIGICLDGGPVPLLVMPFMFNGSLLSYLMKEKANLVFPPTEKDLELDSLHEDDCVRYIT